MAPASGTRSRRGVRHPHPEPVRGQHAGSFERDLHRPRDPRRRACHSPSILRASRPVVLPWAPPCGASRVDRAQQTQSPLFAQSHAVPRGCYGPPPSGVHAPTAGAGGAPRLGARRRNSLPSARGASLLDNSTPNDGRTEKWSGPAVSFQRSRMVRQPVVNRPLRRFDSLRWSRGAPGGSVFSERGFAANAAGTTCRRFESSRFHSRDRSSVEERYVSAPLVAALRWWFKSRMSGRQPDGPGASPGHRSGRMRKGLHG